MTGSKEWGRKIDGQEFLVSTSRDRLPHSFVQEAFDHSDMNWAKPLSTAAMQTMLDNSITLGVYKVVINDNESSSASEDSNACTSTMPIGMARLITDCVTMAYLTDVYIVGEFRRFGLGGWLVQCCREIVIKMPALRRMVLFTDSEQAERMYNRELGMHVLGRTDDGLITMGVRLAGLKAVNGKPTPEANLGHVGKVDSVDSVKAVEE